MGINEIINTWWFNLLGYLICVIFFSQFYRIAAQDAKKDGAATIFIQMIAGFSILLLAPTYQFVFPKDPKIYLFLFLACIFYALNDRLQTTARKHIQVSQYVILDRLSVVFLLIFGFTIFKDPFTIEKIIGGLLIFLGNILVLYKKGKFEFNKYVIFAFIAILSFSIAVSIDIGISVHFNLPFYIMLTLIIPAVIISIVERIHPKVTIAQYKESTNKKSYIITGLSWGLLIFFLLRAYQFGQVTVVTPLAATSVLINVLVAYIFQKETDRKFLKLLAAIITVLGIVFTVVK